MIPLRKKQSSVFSILLSIVVLFDRRRRDTKAYPAPLERVQPLNKSLATHLLSAAIIPLSYLFDGLAHQVLLSIGLFATSGAITNWLAVHMLFEKVPFLVGSGVIPSRFEEFKSGIQHLIMNQFFTEENISKFMNSEEGGIGGIDRDSLLGAIDFKQAWHGLTEAVLESPMGNMLNMFGGPKALESLEAPFTEKMRHAVSELLDSSDIQDKINAVKDPAKWAGKVEDVVRLRLEELTPHMVKDIIQEMIRQHLGWLVVWGGAFGGLMGAIAAFVQ